MSVTARLGGRDAAATVVTLERERRGIRLSSRVPALNDVATKHEFDVQVPRQAVVFLVSSGGGVTLRDFDGVLRGSTGGGAIDIEHVHGTVNLSTGGGPIHVADSAVDGLVTTGGGSVEIVRTSGTLKTDSGSGKR